MNQDRHDPRHVFTNMSSLDDLSDDDQRWLESLAAVRVKGVKPPKRRRKRRKANYNQNRPNSQN